MLTRQDKWLLGAYFVGVIKKKWMRYLGDPPLLDVSRRIRSLRDIFFRRPLLP